MAELFGKRRRLLRRPRRHHALSTTSSVGLFGTNGIVAAGIGHAVGVGMSARQHGTRRHRRRLLRRRRGQPRRLPRSAQLRRRPERAGRSSSARTISTPRRRRSRPSTLNPRSPTKAAAYGIPGVAVDGNDVVAVWQAMARGARRARSGEGPTLIEAKTYRTVGHHEGDPVTGTYRTQAEVDAWAARDPIATFRAPADRGSRRGFAPTNSTPSRRASRRSCRTRSTSRASRPEPDPATERPARLSPSRSIPADALRPAGSRGDRSRRAGSTLSATASPRRCGATGRILVFRRGHRRARRHLRPHQEPPGASSAPSAWSIRRSPSRALPRRRSAPRRRARAQSPT